MPDGEAKRERGRRLAIPIAGCGVGGGFLGDLYLQVIHESESGLIEDPKMALRPFGRELLETIQGASRRTRKTVCWSLQLRQEKINAEAAIAEAGGGRRGPSGWMSLGGESLGAAAAVGFSLLEKGLPYDAGCLITARVGEEDRLEKVGEEERKLEAAASGGIERVGIAADANPGRLGVFSHGGRSLEVRALRTVAEAEEYASGLLAELDRLIAGETRWVLADAERRLGRHLEDWQALNALFIPVKVARGLRPRLTNEEYEELERRRQSGDYEGLEEVEKERLDLRREGVQEELEREIVEWEDVRGEIARMVVLGDPGYGKTMLLWQEVGRRNEEALAAIRQEHVSVEEITFGVFVRALEIAQSLGSAGPMLEAVVALLGQRHGLTAEGKDVLRRKLVNGQCLLALDALDEVPVDLREKLDESLKEFATQQPQAKLLVSSRLVGYTGSPIPLNEQDEVEILAFEEPQMERAVKSWFRQGAETAEGLWDHIVQEKSIARVLRCPLLLRLACQLAERSRQKGEGLPRWGRRVELYEGFMGDVVGRWGERAEPRPTREQRGLFEAFAGEVAERLWRQDARRTLWEEPVIAQAVNEVRHEYLVLNNRPDLVQDLCVAGILVPAGPDSSSTPLMFTHRTIGENMVAGALAERVKKDTAAWEFIDHKAWDPNWEEVIVLLAGRLGNSPAHLRRLLEILSDNAKDDVFRHRLEVAARCSAEIPQGIRLSFAIDVDDIASVVWKLWRGNKDRPFWPGLARRRRGEVLYLTRALTSLIRAGARIDGVQISEWLSTRIADEDTAISEEAAECIRYLGDAVADPSVLSRLRAMLNSSDEKLVWRACWAISGIGSPAAIPDIQMRLAELLTDGSDRTRGLAAIAIGSFESADLTIESLSRIEALLENKAVAPGNYVRDGLAFAVRRFRSRLATPRLLEALAKYLREEDRSWFYACDVVGALGRAAATPSFMVHLGALLGHENPRLRCAGLYGIEHLGSVAATPTVLTQLSKLARDGDQSVRAAVVRAVRGIGRAAATSAFLDSLIDLMHSRDWALRTTALSAVSALGTAAAKPIVVACVRDLMDDDDYVVRAEAARAIGSLGAAAATPETLARLGDMLNDELSDIRIAALVAVEGLGSAAATPAILGAVASILDEGRRSKPISAKELKPDIVAEWSDRPTRLLVTAWRAVQRLGPSAVTSEIMTALSRDLCDCERRFPCAATETVEGLGPAVANPEVMAFLSTDLYLCEQRIRDAAAQAVEGLGTTAATPTFLQNLAEALQDKRFGVQRAAAKAVAWLACSGVSAEILPNLGGLLSDKHWLHLDNETIFRFMSRGVRFCKDSDGAQVVRTVQDLSDAGTPIADGSARNS